MARDVTLITGASGGLGEVFARSMSRRGHDLLITARRHSRLERLREELQRDHGNRVWTVRADLATDGGVGQIMDHVADQGLHVRQLINNAGCGYRVGLAERPWEDWERLIRVNNLSLVQLTRAVLPGMIDRGEGGILNVASAAAFQPLPWFCLYASSKSFVLSFSQGLGQEVRRQGIKVSCLCPGMTYSEFVETNGIDVSGLPGFVWMQPEAVVEASLEALERNDPVCTPGFYRALPVVERMLPRRAIAAVARLLLQPGSHS